MSIDETDRLLRRLFQEMKREEAKRMPAFDPLISTRPKTRPFSVRWLRIATAAAAVLVLGVSLTIFRGRPPSSEVELGQWEALSNWQASTDSLLTVSSLPWGSARTSLTDSLIPTDSFVTDVQQITTKEQQ